LNVKPTHRFYPFWDAAAVFIGFFRKPGRFSVAHYSRKKALERIRQAKKGVVLDIGCGTRKLSEHVVAIDLYRNKITDIVADATQLSYWVKLVTGFGLRLFWSM